MPNLDIQHKNGVKTDKIWIGICLFVSALSFISMRYHIKISAFLSFPKEGEGLIFAVAFLFFIVTAVECFRTILKLSWDFFWIKHESLSHVKNKITLSFAVGCFSLLTFFICYEFVNAIITGEIRGGRAIHSIHKLSEDPIGYWIYITIDGILLLVFSAVLVSFIFGRSKSKQSKEERET